MNICTIIAKNYLAHARVLAQSFREAHPDGHCFVLIIDETDGYVDASQEDFTLLRPSEIDVEAFDAMRSAYDVMELSTAVKPWLLRHMLRHHDDGSGIAYMDPDIRVVSRMVELEAVLRERALVLTPHVLQGMPRDGKKPSETDILMAGVYNLGFIGLSDRPDAHLFLDWWSERLLTDCHVAPERGLFVDQRWVDFLPGLVSDVEIFRNPSYNVAYWNLPERELSFEAGTYLVDGKPLRFYHFSGYSPNRPKLLSRHQDRVDITANGALWQICTDYGKSLQAAGLDTVRTLPYEHDVLPSGQRLSPTMRALYRAGTEAGVCPHSLFTPAGESEFMAWLGEPSPEVPALNRFLSFLWASRTDLQRAYPVLEDEVLEGYRGWCDLYGRSQIDIPPALLPDAAGGDDRDDRDEAADETADDRDAQGSADQPAARAAPSTREQPFGVNVAGYFRSELGIGEVARQLIAAMDAAGVPVLPIGLHAPNSRQGHAYDDDGGRLDNPFPVNVICVNADGLPAFANEAGQAFFADRYSVGVWWWETEAFPERYTGSFRHLDEVWVGSHFVAEALAKVSPIPVVYVPVTVEIPQAASLTPGEYGWPDAYTFLYSFDFNSVFERKNPLAAVEAYTKAFAPDDGAALVLKCINEQYDAVNLRRLREVIAGREDIVLIEGYLDPADKDRLMASCDCYVSLHRSEGFGLTLAEAMYLGKPVVATGYSGNMTFMTDRNSYAVDYELRAIGEGAEPYGADGRWAEPDTDDAARLLRHVFDDREDAARTGAQAAADIREHHSAAVVGAVVAERLQRIAARLPPARVAVREPTHDSRSLHRLVERGTRPGAPSRFGKPGAAVRKLVLRAMKPFTAYQVQVNTALEQELREIDARATERLDAQAAFMQARFTETVALSMAETRRLRALSHRLHGQLSTAVHQQNRALDARLSAPERLVAETRALPYMGSEVLRVFDADAAGSVLGFSTPDQAEAEYRAFEDVFRGSEAFIAERQRRYLDVIGSDPSPAVDIGCGRGEFLDVLRAAGHAVTGVDSDRGMVERCRAKGHTATLHGDGIAYLESLPDASLGLIFSAQVAEHLPPDALKRFLEVATQKLRPGGLLVAETVNPHSAGALKAFWVDITHQHPLFPETMLILSRIAGFDSAYVFHPNGTGDVEVDRFTTGEYALVARR